MRPQLVCALLCLLGFTRAAGQGARSETSIQSAGGCPCANRAASRPAACSPLTPNLPPYAPRLSRARPCPAQSSTPSSPHFTHRDPPTTPPRLSPRGANLVLSFAT